MMMYNLEHFKEWIANNGDMDIGIGYHIYLSDMLRDSRFQNITQLEDFELVKNKIGRYQSDNSVVDTGELTEQLLRILKCYKIIVEKEEEIGVIGCQKSKRKFGER